jgi:formyl-CoA transferase
MRRPDMQTDPRFATMVSRGTHRVELTAMIEELFTTMTSLEVAAMLDQAGIANGRLNEPKDVWDHVQFAARDKWREVNTEAGPVRALLPPFTFTDQEAFVGDVPALGQHTDQILADLGYDAATIAAMRGTKAV